MNDIKKQQKRNKPIRKKKVINYKRLMIVVLFIVYIIFQIVSASRDCKPTVGQVSYKELIEMADNKEIESISVTKSSNVLYITKTNGDTVTSVNPQNDTFIFDLMQRGIDINVTEKSFTDTLISLILTIPMTLLLMMFAVYISTTIVGGSTKMFTLLKKELNNVTFDDIKGLGDTKTELMFIVNQMKNWKQLGELGARPCKGALLFGPPGNGKTMIAKAIANEAGINFISASGSDFNEVFVGVGASRVRSLWELAMCNAPCILFIDEIDCLGKRRKGGDGASNDHNQTLNALLQRMDGINEGSGVMVIGATNRKEDLDAALCRPGRFDRQYFVGQPDNKKDRDELVSKYLENKKLGEDVSIDKASKLMVGLSGADIEEVLNEAVFLSLQDNRLGILKLSDIDEAVMMLHTSGVKKDHTSKRDLEITSFHEAGHALVSLKLGLPVSKVSNISYSSGTGGVTMRDMDSIGDRKLKLKVDFENDIKILLAGKCAEEIIYEQHSQGCSNDLKEATKIVYSMITEYGYSKHGFMNENVLMENGVSHLIDGDIIKECNELMLNYNEDVMNILNDNTDILMAIKDKLMVDRTIVNPTLKDFK